MIHVPISVYVFTSSQTPSSSPPDEEHGMFGTQAAYTAATPMWQVSNVSILTASSHDLNRSSNMTGSKIKVNKLVKSSTTMNVCSGREEIAKRVYATTHRRAIHIKLSSEMIPNAHALSFRNNGEIGRVGFMFK